jgi:hypothetical protein
MVIRVLQVHAATPGRMPELAVLRTPELTGGLSKYFNIGLQVRIVVDVAGQALG